jgi:fatty-acyl-CoA synthase
MPVLQYGGRVTTMRRFAPDVIAQQLLGSEEPVTHLSMIPMMYAAIGAQPGMSDADLSHIRCAVVAGAIAPPDLLQAWHDRGAGMQPQYGGTEMGPCALALEVGDIEKAKRGSSGRPPLHTEIRLVDPQTGVEVEQGSSGEILLRGPSITRGYWGRPDGESRDAEGWFHTGDVAWQDEDGYFYYSGRSKEMYKSGGENVYPAEVEVVLGNSPDVEDIAVIGVADEKWGEVGLAVVVAAPGHVPTIEALREFGSQRLAKYKLPVELVVVDSLARNATGKVSREQLKTLYGRSPL